MAYFEILRGCDELKFSVYIFKIEKKKFNYF